MTHCGLFQLYSFCDNILTQTISFERALMLHSNKDLFSVPTALKDEVNPSTEFYSQEVKAKNLMITQNETCKAIVF